MTCEACEERGINCELKMLGNLTTYKLCLNCLYELNNTCLTSKHFKNLLKNGHKSTEFYLHDDFYDEDGNALQPK